MGTDVRRPESFVEEKMWRFVLNSVDGITACSGALASQVADSFGVDISRVSVIYNGVDTELFSVICALSRSSRDAAPKQFLVSIGSYIPRKGHLVLLEAFSSSVPRHFPELHLVIVGMDGSERQALVDRAIELGLDQSIDLYGWLGSRSRLHPSWPMQCFVSNLHLQNPLGLL
jgi:glycosyltransferase involved in cell wall biosynthesis